MNTLLILGNPTSNGNSLTNLLHQWENSLDIKIAPDEDSAIDILTQNKIDLTISNLALREHQNLKTLLRLTSLYPFIPCMAITNTGKEAMNYGASICLQTPLDNVKFLSQVAEFLELETRGTIRGIPIHSFLQMIEGEQKTCTLVVSTSTQTGLLYLKSGVFIGAETLELKGEKAAFEILAWEDVVIEIKYLDPRRKQDIDKPLIYMIMEAFRLKDEKLALPEETNEPPKSKLRHISTVGRPLTIDIGTQFRLSFVQSDATLITSMVGMLQDSHIIATAPSPFSAVEKAFVNQERITVKYLHMGLLCMFKTTVLHVIEKPQKMLFLDYPSVIHCREMRRSERLKTDIATTMFLKDGQPIQGKLTEISTTGGLFHTSLTGNKILQSLDIHSKVQLQCHVEDFDTNQKFDVIIRNSYKNSSDIRLGMLFSEPPISLFMEYLKLSVDKKAPKGQPTLI